MAPAAKSEPKSKPPAKRDGLKRAAAKARTMTPGAAPTPYEFPIKPPTLPPGVTPEGVAAPVLAQDSATYSFAAQAFPGGGFPGYSYLSQLATRAEFRAFAASLSTELTREWLEFTDKNEDADSTTQQKIKAIEEEFKRLNVRGILQTAAEHD